MTTEDLEIERINKLSHLELARLWRFSPSGHPYFDSRLPYLKVVKDRLYTHFGGITPEISKQIGWTTL